MCFGTETPKKATAPAKPLGNPNEQTNAQARSLTSAAVVMTGGFAGPGSAPPTSMRVDVGGTAGGPDQEGIKNFLNTLAARIEADDRERQQAIRAGADNPFDGDIWSSLQDALTTPSLAIFRAWTRKLVGSTTPQMAVREVVLAVVQPYFDFLGGRDAVIRLVDGWVDTVGDRLRRSGKGFDQQQFEALVAGLMIGFRVAQLGASKQLMYGIPIPIGRGPVDRSGGMPPQATVPDPTAWAGKAEAYPIGETVSIFAGSAK